MRCVLLCILGVVEGKLCLLEVMRCVQVLCTSSLIARRGRRDSVILAPYFAVNVNRKQSSELLLKLLPAILPAIAVPGLLSFSSRFIVLVEVARVEEVSS